MGKVVRIAGERKQGNAMKVDVAAKAEDSQTSLRSSSSGSGTQDL